MNTRLLVLVLAAVLVACRSHWPEAPPGFALGRWNGTFDVQTVNATFPLIVSLHEHGRMVVDDVDDGWAMDGEGTWTLTQGAFVGQYPRRYGRPGEGVVLSAHMMGAARLRGVWQSTRYPSIKGTFELEYEPHPPLRPTTAQVLPPAWLMARGGMR